MLEIRPNLEGELAAGRAVQAAAARGPVDSLRANQLDKLDALFGA